MRIESRPTGLRVRAPAKLNLFLEILGRRDDGYHELETLMVGVDVYDTLEFTEEPSGRIAFRCDDATVPGGSENLLVRAAELLRRRIGTPQGAQVRLTKQIPAAAGLAGGSSDAAATLVGLSRLWQLDVSEGQLSQLGTELGSDVAFFFATPAALCHGRGERITPFRLPIPLPFVIVCPPVGSSTVEVYRQLTLPQDRRSVQPLLEALAAGDLRRAGRSLFNRLQPVAERLNPEIARVGQALARCDCLGSQMSGSGSAYFALCAESAHASEVARRLRSLDLGRVFVAHSISS